MHNSNLNLLPLLEDALVTIAFDGLGLFCETDDQKCEVGVMHSPSDHQLAMLISRVKPDVKQFLEIPSFEHDIKIEVSHPTEAAIKRHINDQYMKNGQVVAFDKIQDKGDPQDLRWMIDLEKPPFHNGAMTFGADPSSQQPRVLKPVIIVPTGIMYTLKKVDQSQSSSRVRFDVGASQNDGVFVGRVGHALGIDIPCEPIPESWLIITNVDANGQTVPGTPRIELPGGPGVKYEIVIRNLCTDCPSDPQIGVPLRGTDFRFYYDVVHHQSGEKFDLRRVVDLQLLPPGTEPIPEVQTLGLDGDPQACHFTFLSMTERLPRG